MKFKTFAAFVGPSVFMMLLFIRYLPVISIFEMRTLVPGAKKKEH